jgi:hypothetical protein
LIECWPHRKQVIMAGHPQSGGEQDPTAGAAGRYSPTGVGNHGHRFDESLIGFLPFISVKDLPERG